MTRYQDAIATLSTAVARRGIHYSLDRLTAPLEKLGNPQLRLPPCIHVAGTNGKGSTTAMIQSALTQLGYQVGTYTSPHILSYCERISWNSTPIDEAGFSTLFDQVWPVATAHDLSEFETLTIMGLLYFTDRQPDFVVIETGLGGRLDATNVISPAASVITPIGLDHQDILGSTLTDIAKEKAGIIKPGVPAFSAIQDPSIRPIFLNATQVPPWKTLPAGMRLTGDYQRQNAALAEAVVSYLCPNESIDAIQKGIKSAQIWGRWTQYQMGAQRIIVDGAHNAHGIRAMRHTIERDWAQTPVTCWMGMLTTKNLSESLVELPKSITQSYTYCPDVTRWHSLPGHLWNDVDTMPPVDTPLLLITGSLYFIATVRPLFDTLTPL